MRAFPLSRRSLIHFCSVFISISQSLLALPFWVMGLSGLEPPTSRLSGVRSNRLSYKPIESGIHLLSHAVSSIVPSAGQVLTVVFGMGTGVSHKRIDTRILCFQFRLPSCPNHLTELRSLSRFAQSANTICQLLKSEKVNFFIFSSLPSRAGSLKSSTVYKTLTSSSLERR